MTIETRPLTDIHPYLTNPKTHEVDWILNSIQIGLPEDLSDDDRRQYIVETLIDQPIVVDGNGVIIKGHGRLKAAQALGLDAFPVVVRTDLTPEEVRLARIADNRSQEGGWDFSLLDGELASLHQDAPYLNFQQHGLTDEWLDELKSASLSSDAPTVRDAGQLDTIPPEPATPITRPGDLWVCGTHRVLCGDSTQADDVARLMHGEQAQMCFTSPPYNAGNTITGAYHRSENGRTDLKPMYATASDKMAASDYCAMLWRVLSCLATITDDQAPILWNVSYNAHSRDTYGQIIFSPDNPFTVKETIIWDKGVGMNIAQTGILSRSAELIFLMSQGDRYVTNQTRTDVWWNIWRITPRDGENMQQGHGASFPVALPREGITRFSHPSAILIDPFGGSGTTLIACEQLGRHARLMEISPTYCDIILRRYMQTFERDDVFLLDGDRRIPYADVERTRRA